jgi:hypothetical protein
MIVNNHVLHSLLHNNNPCGCVLKSLNCFQALLYGMSTHKMNLYHKNELSYRTGSRNYCGCERLLEELGINAG